MRYLNCSIYLTVLFAIAQPQRLLAQKKDETQPFPGHAIFTSTPAPESWTLVFSDEFNSTGDFDHRKWSHSPRARPAWAKFLTTGTKYASLNGNSLVLRMDRDSIPGDDLSYHSGGVQTSEKFSLCYGKIEVKARFKHGKGSWPAIWMMPARSVYGDWPNSGEIDIMEHVNNEDVIHQTIHNGKVTSADGGSSAAHSAAYNRTDFNTYSIIWTRDAIRFYVNNDWKYTYEKKANATFKDWPFDQPFYLILNQSGGAGWPGSIANTDLPFFMEVDWVKIYKPAKS